MKKTFVFIFLILIGCSENPNEPDTSLTGWWQGRDRSMEMTFYIDHSGDVIEGYGWFLSKMWGIYYTIKGNYYEPKILMQFITAGFQPFIVRGIVEGDSIKAKLVGSGFNDRSFTFVRLQGLPKNRR